MLLLASLDRPLQHRTPAGPFHDSTITLCVMSVKPFYCGALCLPWYTGLAASGVLSRWKKEAHEIAGAALVMPCARRVRFRSKAFARQCHWAGGGQAP